MYSLPLSSLNEFFRKVVLEDMTLDYPENVYKQIKGRKYPLPEPNNSIRVNTYSKFNRCKRT